MKEVYSYKVTFVVKHIKKKSALYGLLSPDQVCKFGSFHSAQRYAKSMTNFRNKDIQVIGVPVIEKL